MSMTSFKSKIFKVLSSIPILFYIIHADIIFSFAMQHGSFPIHFCRLFKKIKITDFYLSFYDTEVNDYRRFNPSSKKALKYKMSDYKAITCSDLVFFLNQAEAEYYTKILNININSINYRIIPLCIDKKPFANLNYFKKKKACVNLCWWGSYVPLQGLDIILKAMAILKNKFNIHLYIWGISDSRGKSYTDLVTDLNIEDIVTIHNEWGNWSKWEDFIVSTCDISLGIFGSSTKAQTVLANKVIDGVAFKTPVITAHSLGLFNYFNGIDDIFVTNNNPDDLVNTISHVINLDYGAIEKRINAAYKIYLDNFTPEKFYDKLEIYLNEYLEKKA
jgi:glycosyltransferase involved in cell wall biosynthesis